MVKNDSILAPHGIKVGQIVVSGNDAPPEVGNAMPLSIVPLGSIVHNIELNPSQGGKQCRSAGSYAQLLALDGKFVTLKMASGETRLILGTCIATIGSVSNPDHSLERHGKAGRNRWHGVRPRTWCSENEPCRSPNGWW